MHHSIGPSLRNGSTNKPGLTMGPQCMVDVGSALPAAWRYGCAPQEAAENVKLKFRAKICNTDWGPISIKAIVEAVGVDMHAKGESKQAAEGVMIYFVVKEEPEWK